MKKPTYLFRKLPRQRVSSHALLLGLASGLVLAPPAIPQTVFHTQAMIQLTAANGCLAMASPEPAARAELLKCR